MKQILFVEDDETIAMGVENLLQISGYEVHHFTNAEDAIASNVVWDIAVLDVMLPGMSGIDLLKELKSNSPNPIIMLTAKGTTRDIIQGLDNGADDYVTTFQVGMLARIRARMREQWNDTAILPIGKKKLIFESKFYEKTTKKSI